MEKFKYTLLSNISYSKNLPFYIQAWHSGKGKTADSKRRVAERERGMNQKSTEDFHICENIQYDAK